MTIQKVAVVTGITCQDGAYLAQLFLKNGYEVHGIKRRTSLFNTDRIDHLYQNPHVRQKNSMLLTTVATARSPDDFIFFTKLS